jgi:hypothetical protein
MKKTQPKASLQLQTRKTLSRNHLCSCRDEKHRVKSRSADAEMDFIEQFVGLLMQRWFCIERYEGLQVQKYFFLYLKEFRFAIMVFN